MKIDQNVAEAARHFAGTSLEFAKLMQAVVLAEGNIVKAVQCSIPSIVNEEDALDVLARSAAHALVDFVVQSGLKQSFSNYWSRRWAPVGATNDPKNMNVNWPGNVARFWSEPIDKVVS